MLSKNTDFPDKVVKTWKWTVDQADYHVPDGIDPGFFIVGYTDEKKRICFRFGMKGRNFMFAGSAGRCMRSFRKRKERRQTP